MIADIQLDHRKCKGENCGKCAYVCPTNVFTINEDKISIRSPEYCKMCGECLEICPSSAISLKKLKIILNPSF